LRTTALARPAPTASKEVLAVMVYNTTPADFGMPACGRGRVASVRALAVVANAAVIDTSFPGTTVWRPPN